VADASFASALVFAVWWALALVAAASVFALATSVFAATTALASFASAFTAVALP
jgi:hypothetical protein